MAAFLVIVGILAVAGFFVYRKHKGRIQKMLGDRYAAPSPAPVVTPQPIVPVSPPPVVVAPPVAVAPVPNASLLDEYPTPSALKADADRLRVTHAVTVDGVVVHAGFGPPITYMPTQFGTVKRG